ncbi:3',5'-cyclic-nucleotide phosphodiesterase pde1 [Friedmanniomyces endolithicus]|nr:3',5'-cyclic-nucleotide phosphodiesterase pde1 [Friedmanniomyces endolithicus]
MKDKGDGNGNGNGNDEIAAAAVSNTRVQGQKPALQVICLGSSGGPCEENVTGFLVRSVARGWERGSMLAVDAGSHLAAIVRILERDFPLVSGGAARAGFDGSVVVNGNGNGNGTAGHPTSSLSPSPSGDDALVQLPEPTVLESGPFAGLKLPHASARANALHVLRSYVSTYLITHPHLDHISGFVINTAAFHATSKPKTLAALPSAVDAIKRHVFNDVIWPNLTDEDGGVGFVTFQRLKEGGDVMVGEGEGRGYIDVVDGLGVRSFKVSHGNCTKSPPSHHHRGSIAGLQDGHPALNSEQSQAMGRSLSTSQHAQFSAPGTPGGIAPRQSFYSSQPSPRLSATETSCVVDSTAFFIRDGDTQREVLIFGDVEPDSISLSPRNRTVWQEAARKIVSGVLGGIFIECSYDDTQADAVLFGHLCPRHLIAELQVLAGMVVEAKAARAFERSLRKRKRSAAVANGVESAAKHAMAQDGGLSDRKRSRSLAGRSAQWDARRSSVTDQSLPQTASASPATELSNVVENHGGMSPRSTATTTIATANAHAQQHPVHQPARGSLVPSGTYSEDVAPLAGIKVIIIHIKDTMKDGPHVSESILADLREHEARLQDVEGQGLGCEFVISQSGESYYF